MDDKITQMSWFQRIRMGGVIEAPALRVCENLAWPVGARATVALPLEGYA